jgi:hypothetical protein
MQVVVKEEKDDIQGWGIGDDSRIDIVADCANCIRAR